MHSYSYLPVHVSLCHRKRLIAELMSQNLRLDGNVVKKCRFFARGIPAVRLRSCLEQSVSYDTTDHQATNSSKGG